MPTVIPHARVGTVLAKKYRLDRILGEGGMGVVYAGRHLRLDRPVAVKFLHAQYAEDAQVVERFFAEAQAAARLKHANVVDVYDVDHTDDGAVYMVLEYLDGESLSALLARKTRVAPSEIFPLIVPVLDALSRAHEHGIVHRDLKPDNIFLSRDDAGHTVPKVLDFGIAKLMDAPRAVATATGTVMGTPAYMAPEQAMGRKEIGPWTDVWSMGVVLYEAFTGRFPFDIDPGMPPVAIVVAVLEGTAHSLRRFWPDVPPHIAQAVDRALAKAPADRWQSMREFRAALEASPLVLVQTGPADTIVAPYVPVQTGSADSIVAPHVPVQAGSADIIVAPHVPVQTGSADSIVAPHVPSLVAPASQPPPSQVAATAPTHTERAPIGRGPLIALGCAVLAMFVVAALWQGKRTRQAALPTMPPTSGPQSPVTPPVAVEPVRPAVVAPTAADTESAEVQVAAPPAEVTKRRATRAPATPAVREDDLTNRALLSVISEHGGEVYIDGQLAGASPVSVTVLPGRHILANGSGPEASSTTIDIARGERRRVVLR